MEKKAEAYVKLHNMLSEGDGVIVGVSGGADSMCLLNILLSMRERLKLRLAVLHVNHGIRGESATRDERFVEAFCREKGIDFECVHADVPRMAREMGMTEEEAGRKLRYDSFFEACARRGYRKTAVAHNRDDNAETVLFNIARGSGISGLRGISPVRKSGDVTIIRPLLDCSRKEIEEYLSEHNISFCTDETNLTEEYSRNRIRNTILPMLRENVNSAAGEHLTELAGQAAELERFVGELTERKLEELMASGGLVVEYAGDASSVNTKTGSYMKNGIARAVNINAEILGSEDRVIRRSILRRVVAMLAGSLKDVESVHITAAEELLERGVGKRADLPYGITARRDYTSLILEKNALTVETAGTVGELPITCPVPGEYALPGMNATLKLSLIACEKTINIPKNNYTKFFDYDKIIGELVIRTRKTGDYICVRGTGEERRLHRKSLKSWFIDQKVPSARRDELLLLSEGEHILWIVGDRGDDSCPVTSETKTILAAELMAGTECRDL